MVEKKEDKYIEPTEGSPEEKVERYIRHWYDCGNQVEAYWLTHGGYRSSASKNANKYHRKHFEQVRGSVKAAISDLCHLVPSTLKGILQNGRPSDQLKALQYAVSLGYDLDSTTKIEVKSLEVEKLKEQEINSRLSQLVAKAKE